MSDCTCDKCVGACHYAPGHFKPGEAERVAVHLGTTMRRLFNDKLAFAAVEGVPALRPMTVGEAEGVPSRTCIFLKDNRCSIHAVKPYECRDFQHTDAWADVVRRGKRIARAWNKPKHQLQIEALMPDLNLTFDPFTALLGALAGVSAG